jgi:hypothetical protein
VTTFDLADLDDFRPDEIAKNDNRPTPDENMAALESWAEEQLAPFRNDAAYVVFDIETGPRPEDEMKALFHEKTLEEFADGCDKRWKPDTVAVKYEEYKAVAWQQFVEKAALSPITGRVLLVGVLWSEKPLFIDQADERALLESWWDMVDHWLADKVPMIGHDSNRFDLAFLIRRSWHLGVSVPAEVRQGRYWNPLFRDTKEAWTFGDQGHVSLNTLGEFFGCGQKTEGVSGGDFAKLWFGTAEERQLALDYNAQDLRLTAAVAAKMGMV